MQRPGFAFSVARAVFSTAPDFADLNRRRASVDLDLGGDGDNGHVSLQIDARTQGESDICRAVASHLEAQASGVAKFLRAKTPVAGGGFETCLSTVFLSIFDDCDMWVRKPAGWADRGNAGGGGHAGGAGVPPTLAKSLGHRGRNVHTPVMNLQETILRFPVRKDQSPMRGLDVVAPAVVLPCANAATVLSRVRRWSFGGAERPGPCIDVNGAVTAMFGENIGERLFVAMKDAVGINLCIESLVAAEARNSRGEQHEFSFLGLNCLGHQAVLSMRPVFEAVPLLVSTLTRLGHLCGSTRFMEKFMAQVKNISDAAEYVAVPVFPAAAAAWQAEARELLHLTRCARDLTPEGETYVLSILTDRWSKRFGETLRHLCIPGCPCGGPAHFRSAVYTAFSLLVGRGAPECLMYRWKNFEASAGFVLRGLKAFGVLRRAIENMYSKKSFAEAERLMELAQAMGDVNPAASQTVRAKKVLDFFREHPEGKVLNGVLRCNKPAQRFLNTCFAAEQQSREVIQAAVCEPAEPDVATPPSQELVDKTREAMALNVGLLNGSKGRKVLCEFSDALFDLRCGAAWGAADVTREELFQWARHTSKAAVATWKRLVWDLEVQPKVQLLSACQPEAFELVTFTEAVRPIAEKMARCDRCVDETFTRAWMTKLQGPHRQRFYQVLHRLLPVLPVCSCLIERKHPLGQEAHQKRKRGRTGTAISRAHRTYRKTAIMFTLRKARTAMEAVFGKSTVASAKRRAAFTKQLLTLTSRRRADRRATTAAAKTVASKRVHKARAYQQFRRAQWSASIQPGDPRFGAEQQRVSAAWRALTQAQKQAYQVQADQQNRKRKAGEDDGIARDARAVRKHQAVAKLRRVLEHPVWRSGAQTDAFGTSLKPSLVNTGASNAQMKTTFVRAFDFDKNGVPNPEEGLMKRELTCGQLHGGLCMEDPHLKAIETGLFNLYMTMKRRKLDRKDLPLYLRVGVSGAARREDLLLAFAFGKGAFFGALRLEPHVQPGEGAPCPSWSELLYIGV